MTETYQEYVGRYRILRHEELPPQHKAEYRLRNINPDEIRSLIWSFDDLEEAEKQFEFCVANKLGYETYFFVDNGEPEYIKRTAWF